MGTNTEEVAAIRREIARSRGELGQTIQALEIRLAETREAVVDRVSPKRVWERKTAGVRQRWDDMSDSVAELTGRTENQMRRTKSRAVGQVQELSSQAGGASPALRQRAESNPMGAGLVALGAGFLAATLLPPSERERQAAQRLQSQLQPLKEQATQAGRTVADELQHAAQDRMEQVKERASDAAQEIKQEAQSSVDQVKGEAADATTEVKQRAKSASKQVKETTSEAATPTRPRRAPRRSPSRAGTST